MPSAFYHAAAVGVVLFLLNSPENARDLTVSKMMREAALAAITTPAEDRLPESPGLNAAITLRAVLDRGELFSEAEGALLREWLSRVITQGTPIE